MSKKSKLENEFEILMNELGEYNFREFVIGVLMEICIKLDITPNDVIRNILTRRKYKEGDKGR